MAPMDNLSFKDRTATEELGQGQSCPGLSVGLRSLTTYKQLVFVQRGLTDPVLQMPKC